MLGTARVRRFPLPEIVLWTTASQHPSESQTSECSDLLSRSRATFVIAAQRQPGKLAIVDDQNFTARVSKLRPASNQHMPKKNTSRIFGIFFFCYCYPKRVCHTLQKCKAEATSEQPAGKPNRNCSPKKIDVTRKLPVGSVSVVTLIRTDTTLDHSQKAEKV